uniref:Uncharacterized protein n=1 Tax=Human herpesvirus 2 TaxID=10310 RepID=A0A2U9DVF6_HHV2|nr:hypothetical protein [Human alphaherpesvirus 2]QBH76229.1 hypothetical protein [Human alphaherpesvirus 2]QBH85226.1 hypothetical protein [Human alphaherpesvirus 2]
MEGRVGRGWRGTVCGRAGAWCYCVVCEGERWCDCRL